MERRVEMAGSALAAVCFDHQDDVGGLLQSVVDQLRDKEVKLQGYLQTEIEEDATCRCHTFLEDIATGKRMQISQDLGNGSIGCKLDPSALSALNVEATQKLERKPELLIINRFGRGEVEGHGFRSVIEKAVFLNVPVLCAVKQEYIEEWRKFSGELATELRPDLSDILDWFYQPIKQPVQPEFSDSAISCR